jgi:hypothetical protein
LRDELFFFFFFFFFSPPIANVESGGGEEGGGEELSDVGGDEIFIFRILRGATVAAAAKTKGVDGVGDAVAVEPPEDGASKVNEDCEAVVKVNEGGGDGDEGGVDDAS